MTDADVVNSNFAPYPDELEYLVDNLVYKDHWRFTLEADLDRGQGSRGTTLIIVITCADSYDHTQLRSVAHYFPVPPAAYVMTSWRRWLLEQVLLVERHEACEFFTIADDKPYAPNHGPGHDPYIIRELATDIERRTSYLGKVT